MEGSANEVGSVGAAVPGFLLAFIWIVSKSMSRSISYTSGVLLLLFFCIWMIATFFWSKFPDVTLSAGFSYLMIFIFYWLVSDIIRKPDDVFLVMAWYVVGLFFLSLTAVSNINEGVGYGGLYNRYSADGTDPNNFGMMLVTSLPLIVIFCLHTKKLLHTIICIPIFIFFSYLIISTASRSAAISLLLTLIALLLIFSKNSKTLILNICIAFVALIVLEIGGEVILQNAQERLFSSIVVLGDDDRFLVWKEIIFFRGIEIFGMGAGATFAEMGIQAHNTFVSAIFEAGLLGFILWTSFWLYHFIVIFHLRRHEVKQIKMLFILTIFLLLIASLTLNWEFRKPLFFILALSDKWVVLFSPKSKFSVVDN